MKQDISFDYSDGEVYATVTRSRTTGFWRFKKTDISVWRFVRRLRDSRTDWFELPAGGHIRAANATWSILLYDAIRADEVARQLTS
jgi:hypothetical protein